MTGGPRLPSFWLLQTGGWLAYGVAMALSRVGSFPLRYMVIAKGILAVTGFLLTLGLRALYRPLVRRGSSLATLIIVCVVASYAVSLVWTVADNALDVPVRQALGMRLPGPRAPLQWFSGAVYNAFTLLAWSLLYIGIKHWAALQAERERSVRAEALANRAQLEALRYQLNPHFLFNALNAVSTLVVEHRNDEAARMLARVSDFLRLTLSVPVADEIPLAEEVDYVRRYLEIEQVRFGDRLRTEFDVEDGAWEAGVPSFILQPLIENAVRHAIAPREQGGSISIEARRSGGELRVDVIDDGPGLGSAEAGVRERAGRGATGIGLSNARERLRQLYGSAGRLELSDESGGGVRATVLVPFRRSARTDGAGSAGASVAASVVANA